MSDEADGKMKTVPLRAYLALYRDEKGRFAKKPDPAEAIDKLQVAFEDYSRRYQIHKRKKRNLARDLILCLMTLLIANIGSLAGNIWPLGLLFSIVFVCIFNIHIKAELRCIDEGKEILDQLNEQVTELSEQVVREENLLPFSTEE